MIAKAHCNTLLSNPKAAGIVRKATRGNGACVIGGLRRDGEGAGDIITVDEGYTFNLSEDEEMSLK